MRSSFESFPAADYIREKVWSNYEMEGINIETRHKIHNKKHFNPVASCKWLLCELCGWILRHFNLS